MNLLEKIQKLYKMNDSPFWFLPILYFYGYFFGFLLWFYYRSVFFTSKITWKGREKLSQRHILAFWHQEATPFFVCFKNLKPYTIMFHPYWYMFANYLQNKWAGSTVHLGSTGNSGREAAKKVLESIQKGQSSFITPDGPAGPPKILKKGVLHLAANSNTPVIPVQFKVCCKWVSPSWDRKIFPFWFSKIEVIVHDPVNVTLESFGESSKKISDALNA